MRTRKRDGWGLPHIFSTKQLENMDNFSAFEPHSIALLKLDANLAALKRKQKRKIINPLETETCSNFLKHTSKRESMPVRHSDDRTGKLLQKVLAEYKIKNKYLYPWCEPQKYRNGSVIVSVIRNRIVQLFPRQLSNKYLGTNYLVICNMIKLPKSVADNACGKMYYKHRFSANQEEYLRSRPRLRKTAVDFRAKTQKICDKKLLRMQEAQTSPICAWNVSDNPYEK